jgi:hypothetical protein
MIKHVYACQITMMMEITLYAKVLLNIRYFTIRMQ